MKRITEYDNITSVSENDVLPIVDVSDTEQASTGSTRKGTIETIADYLKARVETLTGKTLTSPVLNTGVSGTAVLDEDDMASDSSTKLATQQSIKAYVETQGYDWKGAWATSTAYVLNDVVRNSSAATPGAYICTEAHTSGTFATDLAASKWDLFVADGDITTTTAKARAYLNTAQNDLVDGTSTLVALDAENYDPGTNFNTTTHQFTAPTTGYYSIVGSVGFQNGVTDKRYNAELRVNGDIVAYSTEVPGLATAFRVPIASIEYVTQGQTIDLYATSFSGGNTVDLIAARASTFLCVHLLST